MLLQFYVKIFYGNDSAFADWHASRNSRGKHSVAQKAQHKDTQKVIRLPSVIYVACLVSSARFYVVPHA